MKLKENKKTVVEHYGLLKVCALLDNQLFISVYDVCTKYLVHSVVTKFWKFLKGWLLNILFGKVFKTAQ